MQLKLPPELAEIVEDAVRSGRYDGPLDVIREALSRLDVDEAHFLALKREIEKGANSPVDKRPVGEVFEEIKRRGRAELAARRAPRQLAAYCRR